MTRVNVIPVEDLADQHLLAEHREIKRIPNVIISWKYSLDWQPREYTLGKWHVKFFYDKLKFLHDRYIELYNECIARWFNVQNYGASFASVPRSMYLGYQPTLEAIKINTERIKEKLKAKHWFYKFTKK